MSKLSSLVSWHDHCGTKDNEVFTMFYNLPGHEPVVITYGDLRKMADTERASPRCSGCGGPHLFDMSVPSDAWNRVIRGNGYPDYLCASCILAAFARNRESFTATLWNDTFDGLPVSFVIGAKG